MLDVYALAVLSSVAWGLSTVISKRGLDAGGTPAQSALVVEVVNGLLFWGALLVGGGSILGLSPRTIGIFVVAGVIGTAIGRVIHYTGVRRVGASITAAGINTRPLFATLLAVSLLGERVTPLTGLGILTIIAGLVTLSVSRGGDIRGWRPRDLVFAVGAAAAYGAGNVIRRFGLTATDASPLEAVAVNVTAAVVVLAAYAASRPDPIRPPRAATRYFAAAGVAAAVALFTLFEALDRGPVVIVDPLSGTSSLFAVLFTAILLRDVERVTARTVLGAALIVVGAGLVTVA